VTADTLDLYKRAIDEFGRYVKAVTDDQLHNSTPCTDWDVHDLLNHLVCETSWVAPLMAGKTVDEVGDEFEGDLLGDDPVSAWESAKDAALDACGEEGALERVVHVSFGDIPAEVYVAQLWADLLIHSWDLARGIEADDTLDPELVEICYAMSKPMEDFLKTTGSFGEKIEPPEDADLQTKLLAVFGRVA
jgi:uncharacterized protein (TIGR03086 family)